MIKEDVTLSCPHDTQQSPDDHKPRGVALRVSADKGITWENEIQLLDPERSADDLDCPIGYPAFQNLPDRRILVVFYSAVRRENKRVDRIIDNIVEEVPASGGAAEEGYGFHLPRGG